MSNRDELRREFNLLKLSANFRKWRFDTYINQKGRCAKCRKPMFLPIAGILSYPSTKHMATIDHKIALIDGGINGYSNYELICYQCNYDKKSRRADVFIKLGLEHKLEKYQLNRNRKSMPFLPHITRALRELSY